MLILFTVEARASAWTRDIGEIYGNLEFLDESSRFDALFENRNANYYRMISYKLYMEYGLFEKFTIGGYVKNYNYSSKYFSNGDKYRDDVRNDYYANLFFIQNLFRGAKNILSTQFSFYFPIKYSDITKYVNTVDMQNSFEISLLFGRSDSVGCESIFDLNLGYYMDSSLSYKIVDNIDYDQITFAINFGFRTNESSAINLRYEYLYYIEGNLFDKEKTIYSYYEGYNTSKVEISFNYRFLDNLATKYSFYKNFSETNSVGITFAFVFNM